MAFSPFSTSRTELPPPAIGVQPENESAGHSSRGNGYENRMRQRRLTAPDNNELSGRGVPQSPGMHSFLTVTEESQSPCPPSPFPQSPYPSPSPSSSLTTHVDLQDYLKQPSSAPGTRTESSNNFGSDSSQTIHQESKNLNPPCKRHINDPNGKQVKRQKRQQVNVPTPSIDEVNIPVETLQVNMGGIIDGLRNTNTSTTNGVTNTYRGGPSPPMNDLLTDADVSEDVVNEDSLNRLLVIFLLTFLSSEMQHVSNNLTRAPQSVIDNVLAFMNQIQPLWNKIFGPENPDRLLAKCLWQPQGSFSSLDANGTGIPQASQVNMSFNGPTVGTEATTSEMQKPFPFVTTSPANNPSGYLFPTDRFNNPSTGNAAHVNFSNIPPFSEPGPSRLCFPNNIPPATISPTPIRRISTGQSMGPPEQPSIDVVKGEGNSRQVVWRIRYADWTNILHFWKKDIDPENTDNNKKANIGLNKLIKTIFSEQELLECTLSGRKGSKPALDSEKLLVLYAYVAYIRNNPENTFPENAISINNGLSDVGRKYVKHWVSQLCHETKSRHSRQIQPSHQ